jgi:AcrR family transcriptional regulator
VTKKRTLLHPDERRRQLLEAATWVFARKGYRNAGVSDIIARAGVARGTFYLYFKSKEQIFLDIVEDFYRRTLQTLGAMGDVPDLQAAGDVRTLIAAGFRRWLAFAAANRDAAALILKEASSVDTRFEKGYTDLRRSAAQLFAARFRQLQHVGLVTSSVSADLIAHLQLGMFDELLNAYVLADPNADLDALAAQLADFEWNGIRPDREE